MDTLFNDIEIRILGCLVEKEMTTPEYYPLTLNSLISACNQKSNRNPVVSYDEATVEEGVEGLRAKGFVSRTMMPGSRTAKYLHALPDRFDLSREETAVLCELMLRGPQTLGEIRSRAERMTALGSLEDVEGIIQGLMEHDPVLVTKLPRETGRKESRYAHLLAGEVSLTSESAAGQGGSADRLSLLEEEVTRLRQELVELRQAFEGFKTQF